MASITRVTRDVRLGGVDVLLAVPDGVKLSEHPPPF